MFLDSSIIFCLFRLIIINRPIYIIEITINANDLFVIFSRPSIVLFNLKVILGIGWVFKKNIIDFNDVRTSLLDSNADGIMIGRGSYGRPWIFKQVNALFEKSVFKIGLEAKKNLILQHFENVLAHYSKEIGIKTFRKHLCWYSKSLVNSNEFRRKINTSLDDREIKLYINHFFS